RASVDQGRKEQGRRRSRSIIRSSTRRIGNTRQSVTQPSSSKKCTQTLAWSDSQRCRPSRVSQIVIRLQVKPAADHVDQTFTSHGEGMALDDPILAIERHPDGNAVGCPLQAPVLVVPLGPQLPEEQLPLAPTAILAGCPIVVHVNRPLPR